MAYALNSSIGTKRITLSSSGQYSGEIYNPTFRFSRDIPFHESLMNIVSLDMMTFTHPTFFSEKYMSGYITLGGGVGVPITTAVTADQLDPAHMFRDMFPRAPQDSNEFYVLFDNFMYYFLLYLKNIIQDDTACLNYEFIDAPDNVFQQYKYNNQTVQNLRILYPLDSTIILRLSITGATVLTLTGNWCQLFGLSPSSSNVLSTTSPLLLRVPFSGHDHIAVSCDILEPQYCSMNGEKLSTSELMTIVPTPGSPGDLQTYLSYTTGGKSEIAIQHLDSITLEFTDKQGNYILSLTDFVVVLVLEQFIPTPFTFEARRRSCQSVRCPLRIHGVLTLKIKN